MKTLFQSFIVVCLCIALNFSVPAQQPTKARRSRQKAAQTQKKSEQPVVDKAGRQEQQAPQSHPSQNQAAASTPKAKKAVKIEKIGVIFSNFSSWGEGRWKLSFSRNEVEKELLEALKDKSSKSTRKTEVIKVKDAEEAQTQGIQIVFALDYSEKAGGYNDMVIADGTCTDIFCALRRVDQSDLTTNWDNLSITKRCQEIKVEQKSEGQGNLRVGFRAAGVYAEEMMRNAVFRMAFVLDTSTIPELQMTK
ncbi:MAG TPA: hypothetical protein VJ810_04290 [Blastocatellia bacterium]|nr:hypothetical protein [Blastocatellia bacterium]